MGLLKSLEKLIFGKEKSEETEIEWIDLTEAGPRGCGRKREILDVGSLKPDQINFIYTQAYAYLPLSARNMTLMSEKDIEAVGGELDELHIVFLDVSPMLKNPTKLKKMISKLEQCAIGDNDGDMAKLKTSEFVITPSGVEICLELSLKSGKDMRMIKEILRGGHGIFLNFSQIKKDFALLDDILTELKRFVVRLDGDIARVDNDRFIFTPARVKIFRSKPKRVYSQELTTIRW